MWRAGNRAGALLLFEGLWLRCPLSCKAISFVPRGGKCLQANWGRGEKASLCLLFIQRADFFFALLHDICSLNLSIVICIGTEPAVLIPLVP